ncbi:hypothetical protein HDR60_04515 [bacterium]|nr:hypothetical protein [bacterium]
MNNKKYIISVIALLGFADVVHSAIYQCRSCSAGTYGDGLSTSCKSCQAGTYSNIGESSCTKCPSGKYASEKGSGSCTECPAGKYASGLGNTSCTECPAGKYASGKGNSLCTECSAGKYASGKGNSSCKDCTFGTYQDSTGQSSCKDCPSGKVCPTTLAAISASGCDKVELKSFTTVGSGSGTLPQGIYYVEVAGAGGGGGGGTKCAAHCKGEGGDGSNGDLQTSGYIHVADSLSYNVTVGKGGAGGSYGDYNGACHSAKDDAGSGEKSTFSSSKASVTALGGNPGGGAKIGSSANCKDGSNAVANVNGKGADGGGGKSGETKGNSGANGWVKIYQLVNCKATSSSSTPSYSAGGSSGGGCAGGCR